MFGTASPDEAGLGLIVNVARVIHCGYEGSDYFRAAPTQ